MLQKILVGDIEITIARKRIRNLHLRILPPHGDVVISAPYLISQKSIERFAQSKIGWINKHRERIISEAPEVIHQYQTGEILFLLGEPFELVVNESKPHGLVLKEDKRIILHISRPASIKLREALLDRWYSTQLEPILLAYIGKYEPLMGVRVKEIKIRKMKTRWGTCNPSMSRLRFNLELARKPLYLVEYIVLHEMVHLLERGHNDRFYGFMDKWMPEWRNHRKELRNRVL